MEKVYRLLPWLDMAQAVDYLEDLTKTPFTEGLLLQLCDAGECAVYMDCRGWNGESAFDVGEEAPAYEPVVGRGYCKVEYPLQIGDLARHGTHVTGPAWLAFESRVKEDCEWWIPIEAIGASQPAPIFKSADIRALAEKMNGAKEQPSTAEVEDLRQQLEQEHAARQTAEQRANRAEAEAAELRKRLGNGKAVYEGMRQESEATENDLVPIRAKYINELRYQLLAAIEEIEILRRQAATVEHANPQPEVPATGLTFPYATKELEAMRAAVAKYWENFTPDKRQPTQVEVQLEICELLGLERMKNGDLPRKAIVLATAIRPGTLPDA